MFPPKTRGEISIPVLLSLRLFIWEALFSALLIPCPVLDEMSKRNGTRFARRTGFVHRGKGIYFVIPNEVRNLSLDWAQEKRDSSACGAPRFTMNVHRERNDKS